MVYTTLVAMTERFGAEELILLTGGGAQPDQAKVDQAISDAEAEIDSYLQQRYTLPLSTVPAVLGRLAADMARYYLHDHNAPELIGKRFEHALKFLGDVAAGRASIGVDDAAASPTAADNTEIHSDGRIWDRSDSQGYL